MWVNELQLKFGANIKIQSIQQTKKNKPFCIKGMKNLFFSITQISQYYFLNMWSKYISIGKVLLRTNIFTSNLFWSNITFYLYTRFPFYYYKIYLLPNYWGLQNVYYSHKRKGKRFHESNNVKINPFDLLISFFCIIIPILPKIKWVKDIVTNDFTFSSKRF